VSEWVGLGGVETRTFKSPGPVQIRMASTCSLGVRTDVAVWQVRPGQANLQLIVACGLGCGVVTPGDDVFARVRYLGGRRYSVFIDDHSWDWSWHKVVKQPASDVAPKIAEWIVEAGGHPLANFKADPIEFTGAFFNNHHLVRAVKFEAGTPHGLETSVSAIGQYGGAGPHFTVKWLRP